ncbi:unnamed protein product [Chironomus riparius]|uniref:Uncharacterized protein n=1 Tax=Chironomus riparius TaxID=315576 RepID=A0A9N9RJ30_9DIPT|nr:unnamed protein product [Chironomus riparius]
MWNKLFTILAIIAMATVSHSADLKCNWIDEFCTLPTITGVTNANEVINVVSKPANYVNTATTFMSFNYTVIYKIPVNVFNIFKNLNSFGLNYCPKLTLTTDAFINCDALKYIQISYTANITYVPEGFAQKCVNLLGVRLDYNGIDYVDKNAFKGLSKLQVIWLNGNRITCLHPDLFQNTLAIQVLYLQFNKITAIDQNLFRNLRIITSVNLSNNLITHLPPLIFPANPLQQFLIVFYINPIAAIKPDFCNTFANRPSTSLDSIKFQSGSCFPTSNTVYTITKQNCQTVASYFQGCYSKWTSAMSVVAQCEMPPMCISPELYMKFLEFMKTNP